MAQKLFGVLLALSLASAPLAVRAETTDQEKMQNAGDRTLNNARKGMRDVSDKLCRKGDAHCAAQKAKHKAQNAADDVEAKAKEIERKAD